MNPKIQAESTRGREDTQKSLSSDFKASKMGPPLRRKGFGTTLLAWGIFCVLSSKLFKSSVV